MNEEVFFVVHWVVARQILTTQYRLQLVSISSVYVLSNRLGTVGEKKGKDIKSKYGTYQQVGRLMYGVASKQASERASKPASRMYHEYEQEFLLATWSGLIWSGLVWSDLGSTISIHNQYHSATLSHSSTSKVQTNFTFHLPSRPVYPPVYQLQGI